VNQEADSVGQLVLVATPLGNLGDLSSRALELLENADAVYCEDTRHSRTLFTANAIEPRGRLHPLHEHNEASMCDEIVARVAQGDLVVLISDAGTPGISDPGERVAAAVAKAGLPVSTAPGPSALIAALSISGLSTARFVFEGFVPRKAGERSALYESWEREPRTIVFYESPQRIVTTMNEVAEHFGERHVAVARELTKVHEEVLRGSARAISELLRARPEILGEIVVVLEGAQPAAPVEKSSVLQMLREEISRGASTRDAVEVVTRELGVGHREVYRLALELRKEP
jgi:16S rRNA (cytidine1402-2'-O)-methyltransferase